MSLRRWIPVVIAVLAAIVLPWQSAIPAAPVPASDIRSLMADLSDVRTTRRDTLKQILELAREDPAARNYVVQRLPEMIKCGTDEPWLNAVRLAGKLKATEAIPALQQAMSRPPFPAEPYITAGGVMRLDHDIVAKALSQMGDSAIPSVLNLLTSADERTRGKVVLILININSNASRKALRDHLPNETDPDIKNLIKKFAFLATPTS
jgi:hypothetical protein